MQGTMYGMQMGDEPDIHTKTARKLGMSRARAKAANVGIQMGDEPGPKPGPARKLRAGGPVKAVRRYVYLVIDNCPAEWGEKAVLGVRDTKKADDFMLREKGKDAVANQYYEVQKWRVR